MLISRPYHKIKKDYQRKNLQNPFFRRPHPGRRKYWVRLSLGVGAVIIAAALWFFLFSSFWRWNQVKVDGLTRLPAGVLEELVWEQGSAARWLLLRQSNIFVFDADSLEKKIGADYNFAGLEIQKAWPRTLVLKVSERPYAFIWQEGSALVYASADGYAIQEPAVSEEDRPRYPILDNQTGQTMIGDKDKIGVNADYLDFFLTLVAALSVQSDLTPEKFIIDREFNTLRVKFVAGPVAYFNTKASASDQVNNLVLVKNAKIKDNFSKTNYIDLRYGEKIFVHPEFND